MMWTSRGRNLIGRTYDLKHFRQLFKFCMPSTSRNASSTSDLETLLTKQRELDTAASMIAAEQKEVQSLLNVLTDEAKSSSLTLLGGDFERQVDPDFLHTRNTIFDELWIENQMRQEEKRDIFRQQQHTNAVATGSSVWLESPDGRSMEISKPLVDVSALEIIETYGFKIQQGRNGPMVTRIHFTAHSDSHINLKSTYDSVDHYSEEQQPFMRQDGSLLWDLSHPIPFTLFDNIIKIQLLGASDEDGQRVLRHSSAHILGACFENLFGAKLSVGPPTDDGFFYDAYMGGNSAGLTPDDLILMNKFARKSYLNKRLPFQRLDLFKEDALRLFADNPFKVDILSAKVPDGARTSAYRVGNMVDLCLGPHVPHTGHIGSFEITSASRSYFKGNARGDPLQRVYGIAFSEKNGVKEWHKHRKEAERRDHRRIGERQNLFFFSKYSPGSAFFTPEGTVIYQRLVDFIRKECHKDGIRQVITPNIFKIDLWETSGHAQHYKDDMFMFDTDDGDAFGLKPMNCPAHCVMYMQRTRSYRDLPIRYLDFGALHRNELSGALGGLTRVRRFQQDDVHIFCRNDQVKEEVRSTLAFLNRIYSKLGMEFSVCLSTRPEKAMGDLVMWEHAEKMMTEALNEFCGSDTWELNEGDGAFYGPKIDVQVRDALGRSHQCATVQLDFQLPLRFKLTYRNAENGKHDDQQKFQDNSSEVLPAGTERPVIIHRAMLGSVERMMAVLSEHYDGTTCC